MPAVKPLVGSKLADVVMVEVSEPEPTPTGDDQVEHRPAKAEAAALAGEAADHLGAPSHLLEEALQKVGGGETWAEG